MHEFVSATNDLGYDVSHSEKIYRGKTTVANWQQNNGSKYGYVFTAYKDPTSLESVKDAFKVSGTIFYDK